VVDRRGRVRYAGLNLRGLREAVGRLIDETDDRATEPPRRTPPPFPPADGPVSHAEDHRGKPAPAPVAEHWLNGRPELAGRTLVLEFWATWSVPALAAVPRLNELADRFAGDLVVLAIAEEAPEAFRRGLDRPDAPTLNDFRHVVALDPKARTKSAFGVTAIPHAIVVSRDGIVRWQGHPSALTIETLGPIVEADGGLPLERRRWGG
jgi:thiol-disulfide isomerase/thioredoxin